MILKRPQNSNRNLKLEAGRHPKNVPEMFQLRVAIGDTRCQRPFPKSVIFLESAHSVSILVFGFFVLVSAVRFRPWPHPPLFLRVSSQTLLLVVTHFELSFPFTLWTCWNSMRKKQPNYVRYLKQIRYCLLHHREQSGHIPWILTNAGILGTIILKQTNIPSHSEGDYPPF